MTSPHIKVSVSTNATYRCVTWSTGGRLTTPYLIAGFEKTKRGVRISPLGGRSSWWGRLAQHGVASYCALQHNPPQPHVMPFTHSCYCYALLVMSFIHSSMSFFAFLQGTLQLAYKCWNFFPCQHHTLVVKAWFGGTHKYWAFVRGAQG